MANMSYCKFENTYHDLQDALEDISAPAETQRDERYRLRLIELIKEAYESISEAEN